MPTTTTYRKSVMKPVLVSGETAVHREVATQKTQGTTAGTGTAVNGPGNVATVAPVTLAGAKLKTYRISLGSYGPTMTGIQAATPEAAWAVFAAANGIAAAEVPAEINEFNP